MCKSQIETVRLPSLLALERTFVLETCTQPLQIPEVNKGPGSQDFPLLFAYLTTSEHSGVIRTCDSRCASNIFPPWIGSQRNDLGWLIGSPGKVKAAVASPLYGKVMVPGWAPQGVWIARLTSFLSSFILIALLFFPPFRTEHLRGLVSKSYQEVKSEEIRDLDRHPSLS